MSLNLKEVQKDIEAALAEDLGPGDLHASLLGKALKKAHILAREGGVLCGQEWVNAVFQTLSPLCELTWFFQEGEWIEANAILCEIKAPADALLAGERTALNFLQTLSGTATQTRAYLDALKDTKTRVLDTRKTLPKLRYAQKYAVRCGGGLNHRMGLYDAFLIKENHIAVAGSLLNAMKMARKQAPTCFLEVEVQSVEELQMALSEKPDRILLDNFSLEMTAKAVKLAAGEVPLEASGNLSLERLPALAATGVDYVSVGALTKNVQAWDLSLLLFD